MVEAIKDLCYDEVEVQAARIATGVGKTQIMIRQLAAHIHAGKIGPVIYAVPRHKLGAKIQQQFLDLDIDARIFRGRNAEDPDFNPGKPMSISTKCGWSRLVNWIASDPFSASPTTRKSSARLKMALMPSRMIL